MGSIPAWAGEPIALCLIKAFRMGRGLSPRGRGNRQWGHQFGPRTRQGSIPAWAGEPPFTAHTSLVTEVYPRVGGGTGKSHSTGHSVIGLSPRGRGNRDPGEAGGRRRGSIPAWAGEPWTQCWPAPSGWVYPRVGGETPRPGQLDANLDGLSPRGRGTSYTYTG